MPPAISVKSLRKSFGELEAVRGVDFEVASGEVFGFLGPNGAGKTTTINMLTAFGVMVSARITQIQSFMGVMQLIVMPMFFLSGALFPVSDLPGWLAVLNRLDPLTYAVEPMRTLVFAHLDLSAAADASLNPGVTWFGWTVPVALSIFTVFALGMTMLAIAIWEFNAGE